MTTAKGAIGVALIALTGLSAGTAVAGAAPAVCKPTATEQCIVAPTLVKAERPRGYKMPKIPKGY